MPGGPGSSARTGVRVVVVGDRGTGKSSLISAVASESVPEKVPPVHPPTRLPLDFYPDCVPVTIIDTSSRYTLRKLSCIRTVHPYVHNLYFIFEFDLCLAFFKNNFRLFALK